MSTSILDFLLERACRRDKEQKEVREGCGQTCFFFFSLFFLPSAVLKVDFEFRKLRDYDIGSLEIINMHQSSIAIEAARLCMQGQDPGYMNTCYFLYAVKAGISPST
jgi:hypothetical protein